MLKVLGNYLGRSVFYKDAYSLDNINISDINYASVVAIYSTEKHLDITEYSYFFRQLAYNDPSAIFIAGKFSNKIFDILLNVLSITETHHHIMTYHGRKNWIDDLFLATFPAEESFDKWNDYVIFQVGGKSVKLNIKNYLSVGVGEQRVKGEGKD